MYMYDVFRSGDIPGHINLIWFSNPVSLFWVSLVTGLGEIEYNFNAFLKEMNTFGR